jgi:putrescine transport system ATP-binding protein
VQGTVKEIAYLGDMSVYLVQLASNKMVRITQPNSYRHAEESITWEQTVYLSWHASSPVVLSE